MSRYILPTVGFVLGSVATWFALGMSQQFLAARERGEVARSSVRQTSEESPANDPPPRPVFTASGLTPEETIAVNVYDSVNRSAVNVATKMVRADRFLFPEVTSEESGSGCVIDRFGHIVTNFHVIENAREIQVTLFDGSAFPAELIGADPINDVAVIRIDAPEDVLFPVTMGDSSKLRVGMRVYAIGNPFGLERTLTSGLVSSLNRTLQIHKHRTIKSIIQTDAAINPGSSGGPLVDAHGRLIGITTAIATSSGTYSGVGFAIPVRLVRRVAPELIQHGRVIRGEIGITHLMKTEDGLRIYQLIPSGPADKAGLRGAIVQKKQRGPISFLFENRSAGDLIVGLNGQSVKTAEDMLDFFEDKRPGDVVELSIIRDGEKFDIPVTLSGGEDLTAETAPRKSR